MKISSNNKMLIIYKNNNNKYSNNKYKFRNFKILMILKTMKKMILIICNLKIIDIFKI